MNSLGYRNFDLFVRTNSLMSLQFKKRKRSSNLRKSDDVSSEDDVTVVTNEAKKVKTVRIGFLLQFVGEYDDFILNFEA